MLSEVAEFVYTRLFRPRPLRWLVNRIILLLLPRRLKFGDAIVCLNPADPVVSGALMLRVYERKETRFLDRYLKPGDLFIDVGANIGYYTALAMHRVGSEGRILAFEPDPVSFDRLRQTIAANGSVTVDALNLAAADTEGELELYVSSDNRGDNRLHPFAASTGSIRIKTIPVDMLLERLSLSGRLDSVFVKIDVQGSEGVVIAGMKDALANANKLVLLMEFWPQGLCNMGTDPAALLDGLERLRIDLYELGGSGEPVHIADRDALIKRLHGRKYTNIVGLRQ